MSRTLFSCLQEKVQENRGVSGLAFLLCGNGSVLAGVRSIRFDQGPRPEFLLHLLQSFVCAELLQACRHRRASVGDGRPSACHGCAVACIGQPPPPSAPGPVWGELAGSLSRGCGGRAAASRRGAGVRPQLSSRDCAAPVDSERIWLHWLSSCLARQGWLRFGQIACPAGTLLTQ